MSTHGIKASLHRAWDAETAQVLIKHGADVHARDQSQSTPLHLASSRRNAEIAQLLIKHGADVNARDQSQSTPLHLAWDAGTAQVLIKHGADVHARDQSQSTPLHRAWDAGTAQVLIKHGADVHARDQSQSTPLHRASSLPSWLGKTPVHLLIERGASVNAYDKNHQTPLHRVSSCDYPNVDSLRLLLKNGANVDVEDDKGLTAYQIASAKGHQRIAQLLLDHRARIVSNTIH
jgi:ankyrin repeat protein